MSNRNRDFIIAYVLLVGLPIVGLAAVLKSGRALTAPLSVDGIWKLQADPAQLSHLTCGGLVAVANDTTLAVSQSGKNFSFTLASLPQATGAGTLEGTTFKASLTSSGARHNESDCLSVHDLALEATIDPNASPKAMIGMLSLSDCPSCGSARFHAVKQTPPAGGGR
jgi:hypothetical protein